MEIEKAIEILRTMHTANAEEAEAVRMGADAIGKQIPAPLTVMLYSDCGNSKNYYIYCPCGETVSYPNKCCCLCGQALDWDKITAKVFDVDAF